MEVNAVARRMLANALSGFMSGRIGSKKFDQTVSFFMYADRTDPNVDASVVEISEELYSLYSDFGNHPMDVTDEQRDALWRVLAFLRTDLQYSYHHRQKDGQWYHDLDGKWETVRTYWPFASPSEWEAHRHLLPDALPEYDTTLVPPQASLRSLLLEATAMVLLIFVIPCLSFCLMLSSAVIGSATLFEVFLIIMIACPLITLAWVLGHPPKLPKN